MGLFEQIHEEAKVCLCLAAVLLQKILGQLNLLCKATSSCL